MKNFLYVQPEYLREFFCDGSKCGARCCQGWNILVDKDTHAQYANVKPEADAEKILARMKFNADYDGWFISLDERNVCPFLNENNLCRLQLTYGEKFLSTTCATYPRRLFDFGKFFERSLKLSCPVAAEIILLRDAPLKFELLEVPPEIHHGTKKEVTLVKVGEDFVEKMFNLQVTAISILQNRALTIDQRLTVLGFFWDRLREILSGGLGDEALTKLIAAYESKEFVAELSHTFTAIRFDAEKFIELILKLLVELYGGNLRDDSRKFLTPLAETLSIVPDEKNQVFVSKVTARYKNLADARKIFTARRSTFLENFLVNELFVGGYPWRHEVGISKNFGVFVAMYKFFELLTFSAAQKNFGTDELLQLTVWFTRQADHEDGFAKIFLDAVPADILAATELLIER